MWVTLLMVDYRLSRLAQNDLQNIWDYTVEEGSLSQAEKYIDGFFACFDAIARGKTKGKSAEHIRNGYERVLYGRHIVFFRVGVDQVTEIIRVLHSSMDVENRLLEG